MYQQLTAKLDGNLHRPGDPGYDEARRALRADIDSRPELVIEAVNPADVRTAVLAARELEMPLAIQATGHGTHRPANGGILLKTSTMASVLVDPDRRIARVGPGARWGQVLAATAPFGLAPTSGSSKDVGVTGYTLGGGVGWLSRKYGFGADNVTRAQVVTADGRLLTVSRDQYPDLFWALRGGGGNFGVVTNLEFRLHEVPQVYAGTATFPIEVAGDLLTRYRAWTTTAPNEASTAVVLRKVDGKSVVVVKAMYAGDPETARRILSPLWTGQPIEETLKPMSYADAAMGGTAARYLDLFPKLPDQLFTKLLATHAETGTTVELRHWSGAMTNSEAPVGHREIPFSIILDAPSPTIAKDLKPHATNGAFLNFVSDPTRVEAAFTPANLRRLRGLKRFYDPTNLFRQGLTLTPSLPVDHEHMRRVGRRVMSAAY